MNRFDPNALILSLENAIMQHLREDADDGFHTYEVGEYYPHAIGYCPLKYYYIYNYAKTATLPDRAINITSAGRIAHDIIQSALHRLQYHNEKSFKLQITDDIRIVGRVDAYWPGGKFSTDDPIAMHISKAMGASEIPPHVVEVKSTNYLPREPYLKHKQQLNIYLHAFDVDFGLFIYVSRMNFARRIFYYFRNPTLYKESIEWVSTLHTSLVENKPPSPQPVAEWECDGCPLQGVCKYPNSQTNIIEFTMK